MEPKIDKALLNLTRESIERTQRVAQAAKEDVLLSLVALKHELNL